MTPGNPFMQALADDPDRTRDHRPLDHRGRRDPARSRTGNDGVVAYKSAHIDGVESELVVRSAHSTQSEPATIEEVRRILLLHAKQVGAATACR